MNTEHTIEATNVGIDLPTLMWEGPRDWKDKANCKGVELSLFFSKYSPKYVGHLCKECSVRLTCLEFAIRNDLCKGMFGGLTPNERSGMTVEDIQDRS